MDLAGFTCAQAARASLFAPKRLLLQVSTTFATKYLVSGIPQLLVEA